MTNEQEPIRIEMVVTFRSTRLHDDNRAAVARIQESMDKQAVEYCQRYKDAVRIDTILNYEEADNVGISIQIFLHGSKKSIYVSRAILYLMSQIDRMATEEFVMAHLGVFGEVFEYKGNYKGDPNEETKR